MYLPEHFLEKNIDEIKRIIKEFPLATLITSSTNGLEANHLPFLVDFKNNTPQSLLGHIAIGNPIYQNNKDNEEQKIKLIDDIMSGKRSFENYKYSVLNENGLNEEQIHLLGDISNDNPF